MLFSFISEMHPIFDDSQIYEILQSLTRKTEKSKKIDRTLPLDSEFLNSEFLKVGTFKKSFLQKVFQKFLRNIFTISENCRTFAVSEERQRTPRSPARKISQVHQNFLPAQSAKSESGTDKTQKTKNKSTNKLKSLQLWQ